MGVQFISRLLHQLLACTSNCAVDGCLEQLHSPKGFIPEMLYQDTVSVLHRVFAPVSWLCLWTLLMLLVEL